jgi:hypothetical protein
VPEPVDATDDGATHRPLAPTPSLASLLFESSDAPRSDTALELPDDELPGSGFDTPSTRTG